MRAEQAARGAADFTSALYLGFSHESESLRWTRLTTGVPATLRRPASAVRAAEAFAALVGAAGAVVLSSTLHVFSDLFGEVWRPPAAILHDDAIYPIARWGMERAELRGARLLSFRHLDPEALERRLREVPPPAAGRTNGPWVVTDGFCPGCGRPAPLDAYAALARRWGGRLIVDDTQAIGIFGRGPGPQAPYGQGGGGSIRRLGLEGEEAILVVASLAKGFGAPLAMVAGPRALTEELTERGETLVHCSPPPLPTLAAAERALAMNSTEGDALRAGLAARVSRLRRLMLARGFLLRGGRFPMQRLPLADVRTAIALRDALARRGVEAVVRRSRCNDEVSLTFIVTARHGEEQLGRAAAALAGAVAAHPQIDLHSNLEA